MSNSPTYRLLLGLGITLAAVGLFSWSSLNQLESLRRLQTDTIDRNRKDSLQLLRAQNNLHLLGLTLRDMLDGDDGASIGDYRQQITRLGSDLDDALHRETNLAPVTRTPAQQQMLTSAAAQLTEASRRLFDEAQSGGDATAHSFIRATLQPRVRMLTALVARLLVQNNEAEEAAAAEVQSIYRGVERYIYLLLGGALFLILSVSLYLIRSTQSLFAKLDALSQQRRELAARLISVQEQVLRSISHELHDEFGQILTATGAMLTRAQRKATDPDLLADLSELRAVAQDTLEKVRSLSQILHPAVLDDYGIEGALSWYVRVFERQTGIVATFEPDGTIPELDSQMATHLFRIAQEALNNVARHSGSTSAAVRLIASPASLTLEIADAGRGLAAPKSATSPGLGLVAMRERASLLGGRFQIGCQPSGGTLVSVVIPTEAIHPSSDLPRQAATTLR